MRDACITGQPVYIYTYSYLSTACDTESIYVDGLRHGIGLRWLTCETGNSLLLCPSGEHVKVGDPDTCASLLHFRPGPYPPNGVIYRA
jgi:hypothetical protein